MKLPRIKDYLPRRFFARATLILLIPIFLLQIVVAIIIVQRHFEGVTRQLTKGVALELSVITSHVESSGKLDQNALDFALPLGLRPKLTDEPKITTPSRRHWFDFSGRVVLSVVEAVLARPVSVDLVRDPRSVFIEVQTSQGVLATRVTRSRISASNPHQLIVLTVAAAILLTIISLIFLKNQVRPIRRLAEASEAFGKGHSVPFRPQGAEEVRRAGQAFLAMRMRIERQIEQRTMMLSGVSHDLRTPLTRIRLALATAEVIDDLAEIAQDLDDMEHMLDEFLAFSRGDSLEQAERCAVADLIGEVVEAAGRDGHEIEVKLPENAAEIATLLRPNAMKRALTNLVSNAQKYGTRTRIQMVARHSSIRITVEDDGPGIAKEDRVDALKPFSRLDEARNQDMGGGVGLGLAIASDIARSHGGGLALDKSPALGGLRATIMIPW